MRGDRVIDERCVNKLCPLCDSCRIALVHRDDAKVSILIKPTVDPRGNVRCDKYTKSTAEQVRKEILELKLGGHAN